MQNSIYIAQSLDGYIAGKNGELDWLMSIPNPEGSDYGFAEFMKGIDALVMGRNTFEMVVSFGQWPYTVPVFVPSTTLNELPEGYEDKAGLIKGTPREIIASLKEKGHSNLYIDGGHTIHSFLKEDLIDEIIITTASIILGGGIPLFPELENNIDLELISTEKLGPQLVKDTYKRKR